MRRAQAFVAVLAGAACGLVIGFWLGIMVLSPLFCAVWSTQPSCPSNSSWYGVEWVSTLTAHAGAAIGAALIARLQGSRFLPSLAGGAALSALAALLMYLVAVFDLQGWGAFGIRLDHINLALAVLLPAVGTRLAGRPL